MIICPNYQKIHKSTNKTFIKIFRRTAKMRSYITKLINSPYNGRRKFFSFTMPTIWNEILRKLLYRFRCLLPCGRQISHQFIYYCSLTEGRKQKYQTNSKQYLTAGLVELVNIKWKGNFITLIQYIFKKDPINIC